MFKDRGPWFTLPSGFLYFPWSPKPEDIDPADLAHSLGQLRRWNRACRKFYGGAEHGSLTAFIVEDEKLKLKALCHDVPEVLTTLGDVTTFTKKQIPIVAELENKQWIVL